MVRSGGGRARGSNVGSFSSATRTASKHRARVRRHRGTRSGSKNAQKMFALRRFWSLFLNRSAENVPVTGTAMRSTNRLSTCANLKVSAPCTAQYA